MKATFGNPKYYKKCASNFACGTPMENDENTDWFKDAPNLAKAKELFQKAGYDGEPVTAAAGDQHRLHEQLRADLSRSALRAAGINVQLATSDWGGVVTRRAVKAPPDQGGWNIFITWAGAARGRQPDRLRRPCRRPARRAGSAGRRTRCTRSCATSGRPPAASRSRRRSRARCRRTPGTSCRTSGSANGLRRRPGART